jgi:hypothetical protein
MNEKRPMSSRRARDDKCMNISCRNPREEGKTQCTHHLAMHRAYNKKYQMKKSAQMQKLRAIVAQQGKLADQSPSSEFMVPKTSYDDLTQKYNALNVKYNEMNKRYKELAQRWNAALQRKKAKT